MEVAQWGYSANAYSPSSALPRYNFHHGLEGCAPTGSQMYHRSYAMRCDHQWKETGRKHQHVTGPMFKYGTPEVTYLRCEKCNQNGYRKPDSKVIYTWR